MKKPNIVDIEKGRKYKLFEVKYIGQITVYDVIIFFIGILISLALFFLVNLVTAFFLMIIILAIIFVLIKEWGNMKTYESLIELISYLTSSKEVYFEELIIDEKEETDNE